MLVFLLLGTAVLQTGIDKHKIDLKHQEEFINTEMKKINRWVNYHQYGGAGFRRLLEPIPLVALFYNSITLNELLAFIDCGVRLKHMELKTGKILFKKPFGSLVISAWGFFVLRNIQFLRYLMNFAGENQKIQNGFLRYYLDKKRCESYTKVVPYLSKEQLVSHSKVSLPVYFLPGLILNLANEKHYRLIIHCPN